MRSKFCVVFFSILVISIGMSGCGYTTGASFGGGKKTIFIEPIKNNVDYGSDSRRTVYLPLLEVDVRNAVIDRFLFDGNLKIAQEQTADFLLKGELIQYNRDALRFTDNDDVEEYRVLITVKLELWDRATNQLLWEETSFVGEDTFFIRGSTVTTEESAVDGAIEDLARRIVERTIENW